MENVHLIKLEVIKTNRGLYRWLIGKEFTCQCGRGRFDPGVRKIPWRMQWLPTLVFLPGKSQKQRNLVGYSPWGCRRAGHDLATEHACMQANTLKAYDFLKSMLINLETKMKLIIFQDM